MRLRSLGVMSAVSFSVSGAQALLEVVNDLFEEQTDLEKIVRKIMHRAQTLLKCERCSVQLLEDIESPVCFLFFFCCVCVCVCVSVCLSVWYICAVVEGNKAHLLKYCTQIPNILTVYKVVKTYFTSSIHNSKILLTHSRALLPYNSLCYVEYFRPMLLVTLLYQSRISNAALLPNFFLHCRTCTLMLCKT